MFGVLQKLTIPVIPWWGRVALVAALAVALVGWGELRGYLREEHRLDAYQAQVDALGKQAVERAAKIKADQARSTKEVKDGYEQTIAAIRAAGPRIVYKRASCSPVPPAADSSGKPDGPASEPRATGSAEAEDSGGMSQEFIMSCAMDAARVNWFRAFVIKNHLPVE